MDEPDWEEVKKEKEGEEFEHPPSPKKKGGIVEGVKDVGKFFVDDIRSDVEGVKKIGRILGGKEEISLSEDKKKELKAALNPVNLLKTYWLFFLVVLLAWCLGFLFASQFYQMKCNEYVIKEIYGLEVDDDGNIIREYTPFITSFGKDIIINGSELKIPQFTGFKIKNMNRTTLGG